MPAFTPGLELCCAFFVEVVQPLLASDFPSLPYAAALIGAGSEVLGFDTEMSSDHDWGPRVQLFLPEAAEGAERAALDEALRRKLPREFRGYPTDFALSRPRAEEVNHRIELTTIRDFFLGYLGFDAAQEIEPADWLTFPEQKLRTITAGALYHDTIGLQAIRDRFAYYPHDVWLYLLAAGWNRIGQEEHLMGRAGFVGDEIGSALIGARLVRDLMRLCFLMEKQYAPYPKWFGTAFSKLECAATLEPRLRGALRAETWQEREASLSAAYESVAAMHNALGITRPLPAQVAPFFDRPFKVIHLGGEFAGALRECIQDPAVLRIAQGRLIGSLDQFSDSTDILSDARWRGTLRRLYD